MVLALNLIFFINVLVSEGLLQLIPPLFQLLDQFIKALVDVARLLVVEPLDFLLDMFNELSVVVVDPLGIYHQFVQIVDVLLNDISHVL